MRKALTPLVFSMLFITTAFGTEWPVMKHIQWYQTYQVRVDEQRTIPMMGFVGAIYPHHPFVPEFYESIQLAPDQELVSVSIAGILYETIDNSDAEALIESNLVQDSIFISFGNFPNPKDYQAWMSFIPFIYDSQTGDYKRVVSIDLILKYLPRKEVKTLEQQRIYADESLLASGR